MFYFNEAEFMPKDFFTEGSIFPSVTRKYKINILKLEGHSHGKRLKTIAKNKSDEKIYNGSIFVLGKTIDFTYSGLEQFMAGQTENIPDNETRKFIIGFAVYARPFILQYEGGKNEDALMNYLYNTYETLINGKANKAEMIADYAWKFRNDEKWGKDHELTEIYPVNVLQYFGYI